jgi:hypothetical protein
MTPTATRNIIPENNAYIDANNFPPVVLTGSTGPMPPKIIEALRRESSQDKFSKE